VQVADIRDLIGEIFDDEAIVVGSLRSDFFEPTRHVEEKASPADRVIHFLAEANDERFWSAMERHLMAGNGDSARKLLRLRTGYQIRRRRYPQSFGLRLGRLVASVPITTRRSKGLFPLLPKDVGLELARLARGDDFDDVQFLFQVVAGRSPVRPGSAPSAAIDTEPAALAGVDAVLELFNFAESAGCLTGPCGLETCEDGLYVDPCCAIADSDEDGDVDLRDVAAFQLAYAGD
jgi:hypothetical protein